MSNSRLSPQDISSHVLRTALLTLVAVIALPALGCNGGEQIDSHWAYVPLKIDGNGADWAEYPVRYFRDQEVSVGLANDSANLYIMMRFRDPKWMRTIRMSGLNLYFDNEGGKKKRFTLIYRGGPDPSQLKGLDSLDVGPRGGGDRQMPEGMQDRMGERMKDAKGKEFICAIDGQIFDKEIPTDGAEGPRAAAAYDVGFFTYEFAVPLQENLVRFYGINAAPGTKIGIGVLWGDMSELKQGMRDGGGPDGGGMGGPPGGGGGMGGGPPGGGGGMGGGPPGGGGGMGGPPGGGGGQSQPAKQEIWIKSVLSSGAVGETEQ